MNNSNGNNNDDYNNSHWYRFFLCFFSSKQVRSVYINIEQNICFSVILKMRRKYVNDSKSPALLANTARPLQ